LSAAEHLSAPGDTRPAPADGVSPAVAGEGLAEPSAELSAEPLAESSAELSAEPPLQLLAKSLTELITEPPGGDPIEDPVSQSDIKLWPFKSTVDADDKPMIEVESLGEDKVYHLVHRSCEDFAAPPGRPPERASRAVTAKRRLFFLAKQVVDYVEHSALEMPSAGASVEVKRLYQATQAVFADSNCKATCPLGHRLRVVQAARRHKRACSSCCQVLRGAYFACADDEFAACAECTSNAAR